MTQLCSSCCSHFVSNFSCEILLFHVARFGCCERETNPHEGSSSIETRPLRSEQRRYPIPGLHVHMTADNSEIVLYQDMATKITTCLRRCFWCDPFIMQKHPLFLVSKYKNTFSDGRVVCVDHFLQSSESNEDEERSLCPLPNEKGTPQTVQRL